MSTDFVMLVTAVIITVIFAVIWRLMGHKFGPTYGRWQERNVNLKDSLLRIKPEKFLFVCEGYNLYLKDNGDFIQWIKEAANRGVRVRILLMDDSKTYGLENSKNVSLYKLYGEPESGFVLADSTKGTAVYIQEGQEFTPQVYNKESFFRTFNRLLKESSHME